MFNKLRNLLGTKPADQQPAIDLSLGYSRLNEFRKLLQQKSFEVFEDEYESLDWDARTLLNEGIGLDAKFAEDIAGWVKARPDSYIANLFGGVSKTNLAWIARTAGAGASVTESGAAQFVALLEEASAYLGKADDINPEDPEICARMIRVCMGLSAEPETTTSYFEAAVELQPNHLMAHLMMINYLNPKWLGSIEDMHHFANRHYALSGNNLMVVLPLFAIVEEWVYYGMMGEKKKYENYFDNDELIEKVSELYQAFEEPEEGALMIPYVYNYFSFLFYQAGENDLAKKIIYSIDGKMTLYPWAYIGINSNEELQKLAD